MTMIGFGNESGNLSFLVGTVIDSFFVGKVESNVASVVYHCFIIE